MTRRAKSIRSRICSTLFSFTLLLTQTFQRMPANCASTDDMQCGTMPSSASLNLGSSNHTPSSPTAKSNRKKISLRNQYSLTHTTLNSTHIHPLFRIQLQYCIIHVHTHKHTFRQSTLSAEALFRIAIYPNMFAMPPLEFDGPTTQSHGGVFSLTSASVLSVLSVDRSDSRIW